MKLNLLLFLIFLLSNSLNAQNEPNYYLNFGINYSRLQLSPEYRTSMAGSMRSTAIVENYRFYPTPTIGLGYNLNAIKFKGKISVELNVAYVNGISDYYYYFYGRETEGKLSYSFININLQPTLTIPIRSKFSLKTGISLNRLININNYFEGTKTTYYEVHNVPFDEPIIYNADQIKYLPNFNIGLMLGMTYTINNKISIYANYDFRTSQIYSGAAYPPESINIQSANLGISYAFQSDN